MKPAPFEYHAPTSLAEAMELLGSLEDAKVLAGGQSLIPILALRLSRFDHLVDLGRVAELRGIERANGTVTVRAMTTQADVAADPTVAEAVPLLEKSTPLIGHFQIRNRGTLGGSIAHADPSAEYPAVAVALGAEMEIAGPRGTRRLAATDFFESTFMTALGDDELLTAVHFPVWDNAGFAVEEVARRHGDFALAGVMAAVQVEGGRVRRSGLGLFGVASTPHRADAGIDGADPADLDLEEIGTRVAADLDPPDDIHASGAYRRRVAAVLVERALRTAIQEATRG
ncbi:MAG: xanthine dehydrogenase family protein subunit M [Acidimicrobiaceae bacterium]|nr:xanthine dehydrogenase family protein subunit M [Acidimicrobiaceae bacterium]